MLTRIEIKSAALAVWLIASALGLAAAEEPEAKEFGEFSAEQIEFFEKKVRPLLAEKCLKCHGEDPQKIRGGLQLTSRAGMLRGGESGPAVVPGQPEQSLLIKAVRHEELEMPPQGKLTDDQIEVFVRWVKLGAPDPRSSARAAADAATIDLEEGRKFWAFQPPRPSEPPQLDSNWPRSDIDRFILARLQEHGLHPVGDASRESLIRRAYLTLIGLPPTPAEIDQFVQDSDPLQKSFGEILDRLLESPHFGERWGRHWLDVARFAESSGGGRSLMFPNAWRFRDYVIDAYNRDKPFDQFVKEQIAGDLLPYPSRRQRAEQLIASGFLLLGPINYEQQDKELLRIEVIDEQIDTIGRAFLGLTLGCARCHDHKFDPLPTSDYYALAGILGSTQTLVPGNVSGYVEQALPPTPEEQAAKVQYDKQVAQLSKQLAAATEQLRAVGGLPALQAPRTAGHSRSSAKLPGVVLDDALAKLVGQWKSSTFSPYYVDAHYLHDEDEAKGNKSAVFSPTLEKGGVYEVRLSYSPGGNRASNVPVTIDHQDGRKTVMVNQSLQPPIDGLFVSLGSYRFEANNGASVTVSNAGTDGHVIVDAVQFLPADAASLSAAPVEEPAPSPASGADAARPADPKVQQAAARVKALDQQLKDLKKAAPKPQEVAMSVKDVAQPADGHIHIRGGARNLGPVVPRGFLQVATPTNRPSPPIPAGQSGRIQLAEWIVSADNPLTARVYVNRVWRHLFGLGLVETPDNHGKMGREPSHPELLDHLALQFVADGWSTKKLIRRIMLSRVYQLSSENQPAAFSVDDRNRLLWRANRRRLDAEVIRDCILAVSGQLDKTPGGLTIRKISQYDLGYEFDTVRRSVYVPAFRNSMLELFEVFDFANPNLVVGHRNTSTLPTQGLYLMNSPFVVRQSQQTAAELLKQNLDDADRITALYRRALGHRPTEAEKSLTLQYLDQFQPDKDKLDDRLEAWSSVCHAVFASVDFRFVE